MKLSDLLNTLILGVNYHSIFLVENIKDCQRFNYIIGKEVFDTFKFNSWCMNNNIVYFKTEYNEELVYKLIYNEEYKMELST